MKKLVVPLLLVLLALSLSAVQAQDTVTLHMAWYNDGNEGDVMQALLDDFHSKNPNITVQLDTVDYATGILKTLPVQIQAGQGPDIARTTTYANSTMTPYYLDLSTLVPDADYWTKTFPAVVMQSMRPSGDTTGIYGFPDSFTITGPFINKTLFEQANIPVPSDTDKAVTWQEWTDTAKKVATATGTQYAIAIDRSGHRIAGPALSDGATFFDKDGNLTIDTPGFRDFANLFLSWNSDGITPSDVWVSNSNSYAAAADYFINSQLVFYMAGSWQVSNFAKNIGDKFDWEAVPNPTGPGGSTGMPGGTGIVALKETQHPKEVALLMDYLVQHDQQVQYAAKTLFIPGDLDLAKEGVAYDTDNASAKASLNTFLAQLPNISDQAYEMNFNPQNTAIFNAIRDRLAQVITGELSLDDAIVKMQSDSDAALAAAKAGS
ncbi:MAG TPA: extracellular solute-binding protein [Phototrophicaceae bacterium]|nr:extracellular solute-binding protein [Phototrophicaceae bacterium]